MYIKVEDDGLEITVDHSGERTWVDLLELFISQVLPGLGYKGVPDTDKFNWEEENE